MALQSLKISHFRTHKFSTLEFNGQPVVIFGPNGVGKTNVLEAISLLSPGRGLRRARLENLSKRPDFLGWKIMSDVYLNGNQYEICTWSESNRSRKVSVDGKLTTQAELGSFLRILWITPLMDRIWLEGSQERRSFIDRIVSTLVSDHTENLLKYYKALRQRNKLLKDKSSDENWFRVLEHQMASAGAIIESSRAGVLEKIMKNQEQSNSSFPVASLKIVGSEFSAPGELESKLKENRKKDFWAGRTLIGPHSSDLHAVYSAKAIDARNCSTGEQKALLISIILATARIQIEKYEITPILLFDEISAHLDQKSRVLLYEEIRKLKGQVFLTGTDKTIFEHFRNRAQFFELKTKQDQTICKRVDDPFVSNI